MILDELRSLATSTRNGFACWPAPYQMSPTLEDCEFLHALVRVTKPAGVLELGTGMGVSARFIAEALWENRRGHLVSVEDNVDYAVLAREMVEGLPARVSWAVDYIDFVPDLVFIDSAPQRREHDIAEWMKSDKTPLVLVHDANRKYLGLAQGVGVFLPGSDGLWIGRARA